MLEVDGPADYSFKTPDPSPDGRWLLVGDSDGRLLVVDANGSGPRNARVIAKLPNPKSAGGFFGPEYGHGAYDYSTLWFQPGSIKNTVDLAALRARFGSGSSKPVPIR